MNKIDYIIAHLAVALAIPLFIIVMKTFFETTGKGARAYLFFVAATLVLVLIRSIEIITQYK